MSAAALWLSTLPRAPSHCSELKSIMKAKLLLFTSKASQPGDAISVVSVS